MNTILDKMGIYDLVAVLLSGMSTLIFSTIWVQILYSVDVKPYIDTFSTVSFIVISYFFGLLLQEIGSLIMKLFTQKDFLLKLTIKPSAKNNSSLAYAEVNDVCSYVLKKLKLNSNDVNYKVIYNYCVNYYRAIGDVSKIDKDQSLAAMSRSFSIYFFSMAIICSIFEVPHKPLQIVVFILLGLIFAYRNYRFIKLRYVYIIKYFYYNVVNKKSYRNNRRKNPKRGKMTAKTCKSNASQDVAIP